jgi:ADP-ribosyl-[dinitrogen reductase] hydrolase
MKLRLRSYSLAIMGFFGLTASASSKRSGAAALSVAAGGAAATAGSTSQTTRSQPLAPLPGVDDRLHRALWSFFAGDAVAAPTHWFYGGRGQVQEYYGTNGITGYTKPSFNLAGSILNKSDPSGGGRAKFGGASNKHKSIIGDVINHGKLDLWSPSKQVHYHATLAAGENTLEVQLARVLMRSIVQTGGVFDPDHFRDSYVTFMTTPGSHNDTYASTCHRMFFANMVHKNLDPKDCPDNDGHNVDTVDGLVLPTIVGLAVAARASAAPEALTEEDALRDAATQAALCAGVTRRSSELNRAAGGWSRLVATSLWHGHDKIGEAARDVAKSLGMRQPKVAPSDEMTACYLSSAFPALLDSVVTHDAKGTGVWQALLQNANTGGENVHRGSCLGAVLGAASRDSNPDPHMVQNLHDRERLQQEIEQFVSVVTHAPQQPVGSGVDLEL